MKDNKNKIKQEILLKYMHVMSEWQQVGWVSYVSIACVTIVWHLIVNNMLVSKVFILMCEVAFNALKPMKIYMQH